MKEVIIKTQSELDALDLKYNGTIYIEGGDSYRPLILRVRFEQAYVITRGKAVITMRESSQVNQMWESSQVKEMWESSQVNQMRGSSRVNQMRGEAMVSAYGVNRIKCSGYNVVRVRKSNRNNLTVVMNKDSHLIIIPDPKTTFADYKNRYPVTVKGKSAIMYKAVHKTADGPYYADYDKSFKYEIGKKYKHKCNPSLNESRTYGLHVSHFSWARIFGNGWNNLAILECKVPVDKILVAKDCDGKVRTPELTVVREVPVAEYETLSGW